MLFLTKRKLVADQASLFFVAVRLPPNQRHAANVTLMNFPPNPELGIVQIARNHPSALKMAIRERERHLSD